ncbi:MAG: phenylalanine--tRNA ligase subunit beta [Candidatus Nomurabacteria bacterium]|jgi:phenylalanyl-tRNA synthetase beta chain|nr:phenylalanine--tRNA ligase subunit beta [Candidatus Nomurabacteria bacterium]
MIISLNWLKKYVMVPAEMSTDELVKLIGARLVEVESVENLAPKYAGALIAKVVKCEKHPDSDHLHICQIDDGGAAEKLREQGLEIPEIPRGDDDLITVVCGAPNVHSGMLAVWLPPGTIVPETFGKADEFKLGARKLRGVLSQGMLASPRELDLWDEHSGILEIQPGENIQSGAKLADVLQLDDTLIEVENKSLTHRPDCFGVIGLAREVAGILSQNAGDFLNNQEPQNHFAELFQNVKSDQVKIKIADARLCPRYECAVLTNIDSDVPTPDLIKSYLGRVGMRPIDPIVDVTNFLMLDTGQPLHAFDIDKLKKISPTGQAEILVRAAKTGEMLELLDGKKIALDSKDIVICAGNEAGSVPVALAGAMGGASTMIDKSTKNILLESATFNLYNLRGTQFRHGIFSEAITRFTKGQPAALTDPVLRRAAKILSEKHKMKIVSLSDEFPAPAETAALNLTLQNLNDVLGSDFTMEKAAQTLTNIGYNVKAENDQLDIIAPWWRTDIHIAEDVIEDVGRLNGFDNIAPSLPVRDLTPAAVDPLWKIRQTVREFLRSAGASEVLTYSFVSGKLLQKVGQDPANAYKIVNSISPELQYFRQSLTPSLLDKAQQNLRAGFDNFALFEINQVFQKSHGLTAENVPELRQKLALVLTSKTSTGAAFYTAKNYLVKLLDRLGIQAEFREIKPLSAVAKPFEPGRAAGVWDAKSGAMIGCIGEYRAQILQVFKLPKFAAGFEVALDQLLKIAPANATNYTPLLKFPGTTRDLCFQVPTAIDYAAVENLARAVLQKLPTNFAWQIEPLDIFAPNAPVEKSEKSNSEPAEESALQAKSEVKNITLRIKLADRAKTIDAKIAAKITGQIAAAAARDLNAKLI